MSGKIKIIFISNDDVLFSNFSNNVKRYDYEILLCRYEEDAMDDIKKSTPGLIVIDDSLFKGVINEFLISVRKCTEIPVVLISDEDSYEYKLMCYSVGIDEFLLKKWDEREFVLRVNALIKRTLRSSRITDEILYKDLYVNISSYEVVVAGEEYRLPRKETELLYFLAKNPNRVYTREQLLDRVWGYDYFGDSRTVDAHIKKIRKRFLGKTSSWNIETVWGVGYKFSLFK